MTPLRYPTQLKFRFTLPGGDPERSQRLPDHQPDDVDDRSSADGPYLLR